MPALVEETLAPPEIMFDSTILAGVEEQKALKNLLGESRNLTLLYRGSRDGFRKHDFHKRCDGRKDTVTVVQADTGRKFGGYTDIAWASEGGLQAKDHSSYLFALQHNNNII